MASSTVPARVKTAQERRTLPGTAGDGSLPLYNSVSFTYATGLGGT